MLHDFPSPIDLPTTLTNPYAAFTVRRLHGGPKSFGSTLHSAGVGCGLDAYSIDDGEIARNNDFRIFLPLANPGA